MNPERASGRAPWRHRVFPPRATLGGERLQWLRHGHLLAVGGLWWLDPGAWPLYAIVLAVLTVEWPFCIRLTEGVEIYLPVMWTSAAAAYLLGPMVLPVYWLAALAGFALIVVLDARGIVPATGLAAESARRYRGEPFALESVVDGDLRHTLSLGELALRAAVMAGGRAAGWPFFASVLAGEAVVAAGLAIAPIPGRMAPRRRRARLAEALGEDIPLATQLLHVVIVCLLLLSYRSGGPPAFAAASLSTLALHVILKRLNDTRVESERQRAELLAVRDQLGRHERLALIGQTASTVFHQIARHHGAIGIYAHLLGRGPAPDAADGVLAAWVDEAREHARRIGTSVEEANRVIDELLRFGQDRALNLYRHPVAELVEECVRECEPRAAARGVRIALSARGAPTIPLDKHKVKQALGNVLDNAIEASPPGACVDVEVETAGGEVRIAVRDRGPGVAESMRARLFTPFCTTKPSGIGLGLALARELVEAHGGTLAWSPEVAGAEFVLRLPASGPPGG